MIGAIITKISGFFDKSFLFSSVLPVLIFVILVFTPLTYVIGFDSVAIWVDSLTGTKKAALTGIALINLIVVSYLLSALQTSFLRWWSGNVEFLLPAAWLISLGVTIQTRKYRKLREQAFGSSSWNVMWKTFMANVDSKWSGTLGKADKGQIYKLQSQISKLDEFMVPVKAQEILDKIEAAYQHFSGDSLGDQVYRPLKFKMREFIERDEMRMRGILVALDKEFGNLQTICASRLGNIVQSYSQYASKRYDVDMEVFWTHLRNIIPKTFLESMGEQKMLLDFALTMTTLSLAYSLLCLVFGPWLWYRPLLWIGLAVLGVIFTRLFYRLAITAAASYGDCLRAAFDLYRLELMKALQRPRPISLVEERKQWQELSNLAVYANQANFQLRPESSTMANADSEDSGTASAPTPEQIAKNAPEKAEPDPVAVVVDKKGEM